MVRIAIGISYFLEVENLPACLSSLRNFDRVFCIDGRCPHFDYPMSESDDGSHGVIAKYDNAESYFIEADQIGKRNKYLMFAKQGGYDWVLQVDADETVRVDMDTLMTALAFIPPDVSVLNVMYNDISESYPLGRLVRSSLRYHELHFILRDKYGTEYDMVRTPGECIEGILLTHHNHNSIIHKAGKKAYRAWKQPYENQLRKKRGIPLVIGREV